MTTISFSSKSNLCLWLAAIYRYILANANWYEPEYPYVLHLLSSKRISSIWSTLEQTALWVHRQEAKMPKMLTTSWKRVILTTTQQHYICSLTNGRNMHVCFLVIFHCWLDREMEIYVTCILEVMKRLHLRCQSSVISDLKISRSLSLYVSWFIAL